MAPVYRKTFAVYLSAVIFAVSVSFAEVQLDCTLDSFFLRVKQSSCTCQCDGAPVTTEFLTSTTAGQLAQSTTSSPVTASSVRPLPTVLPSKSPTLPVSCTVEPTEEIGTVEQDDGDRVDCMPGPWAPNIEQRCVDKGCIWEPSLHPNGASTGAPWCFFPTTGPVRGFQTIGCAVSDNVARHKLQKTNNASTYSTPWGDVTFAIEPLGDKVLRLKFYDATSSRYEVPVPLNRPTDGAAHPDYEVKVFNDPFFYFKVIRKSSGTVLFDTSVSGLVLEDQFLQIKTKLPTSYIYGFGENRHRTFRHNMNVGSVPMWTKDSPPGYENGNHYGFHPYYMVVEDDGRAHGVLLLTSNGMEYAFSPLSRLTMKTIGGIFDFYFVLGESAEKVTQEYTALVGRPFLPPYWSLGFQLSRWGYNSVSKLRQIVARNRAAGIPQDVQTCDIDYMRFRQNFVVDFDKFNGLEAYVDELKADGIRTVIILDPAMHADAAIKHPRDPPYHAYTNGVSQDVFIKWPQGTTGPETINVGPNNILLGKMWPDGRSAFPDFFTNRTKSWWSAEIRKQYETLKFDGLWIDMNEPAAFGTNTNGQGQWFCSGDLPGNHTCIGLKCPSNKWESPPYTGRLGRLSDNTLCMSVEQECRPGQMCKHYDVHNLYGWSQSEPTLKAAQISTGKRSLVISRSTYPGNGQHVGHWLGDNSANWGDLQYSIVGMLEFNLFGIPYIGADICGFFNEPSEELCARWQQVGAFYPYARNHNGNHLKDQDPAQWPLVADVTKKALAIRYRLLPYLYTLFYHAHTRGSTVVRPLHHEFISDRVTYDINDQFLWGPGLMIAPVVQQGHISRSVYFPEAQWYKYSGQKVSGNGLREVNMPIDQIGVYYRGGLIFPAQKAALNTAASRKNPFELIVALDENGSAFGDLYWDDGESLDPVQVGNYITAKITFSTNGTRAFLTYTVDHNGAFGGEDVKIKSIHIYGLKPTVTIVQSSTSDASSQTSVTNTPGKETTVYLSNLLRSSFTLTLA